MSTAPARPLPTDRMPKAGTGRTSYAQHVADVEASMRTEFADGTTRIASRASRAEADQITDGARKSGIVIAAVAAFGGVAIMTAAATTGMPDGFGWAGLSLLVVACLVTIVVTRRATLAAVVSDRVTDEVHALAGASMDSLRAAVKVLTDADATHGVIEAAQTLADRGEDNLDALLASEDPTGVNNPHVRALVRDASRVLSLIATVKQRPEDAWAAAAQAVHLDNKTPRQRRG